MKIVPLMLLLLAGTVFVSCQKEVSSSTEPEPPLENHKLLTKIVTSQYFYSQIDSFEYDSQNRCKRYLQNFVDSSISPNPGPYTDFYDFHYNGNETVPFKITDTSQGRGMNWYIVYDAQKRKIADSMVFSPNEKEVFNYTYQANRILSVNNQYVSGVLMMSIKDTFDLDGNNCTRQAGRIQSPGGDFWYQYTNTSFDTHINPISKMNIGNAVKFGGYSTLGDNLGINKNNCTGTSYVDSGGPSSAWTSTIQYTYDSEGYPLTATMSNPSDPTNKTVIKYYYKQ